MTIYDQQLDKTAANFVALSPVSFVERSAEVFGDLPAVIHGQRRYTWAQTRERWHWTRPDSQHHAGQHPRDG